MAKKRLTLRVLTPAAPVLEEEVDFLTLRTIGGEMGILPGHEPTSAMLDVGLLRCFQAKEVTRTLAVLSGIATVEQDRVTVLTTMAEPPEQLEEALARQDNARMENLIREQRLEAEIQRAEMALRRVLVQSDIGAHPLPGEPPATEHEEQQ